MLFFDVVVVCETQQLKSEIFSLVNRRVLSCTRIEVIYFALVYIKCMYKEYIKK